MSVLRGAGKRNITEMPSRYTIEDLHFFARQMGGKYLSKGALPMTKQPKKGSTIYLKIII